MKFLGREVLIQEAWYRGREGDEVVAKVGILAEIEVKESTQNG